MNPAYPHSVYGPSYGYTYEQWEEAERLLGLQHQIDVLEYVAAKATKRTTLDIIFNRLCECNAAIAAIVLARL